MEVFISRPGPSLCRSRAARLATLFVGNSGGFPRVTQSWRPGQPKSFALQVQLPSSRLHLKCNAGSVGQLGDGCGHVRAQAAQSVKTGVCTSGGAEIDLLLVWLDGESWAGGAR